jgi:hypothetical protein
VAEILPVQRPRFGRNLPPKRSPEKPQSTGCSPENFWRDQMADARTIIDSAICNGIIKVGLIAGDEFGVNIMYKAMLIETIFEKKHIHLRTGSIKKFDKSQKAP